MTVLKITRIGNSLGVILPKEILASLKVDMGDSLFVSDLPGGVVLSPYDAEVAAQIEAGRSFMNAHRDAFRALAK